MKLLVVGQRADEPVRQRTVTLQRFLNAWGPYGEWLLVNATAQTAIIGEYKIRVVVMAP